MKRAFAHLSFNGNCRAAMHFYKNCFGGELNMQTLEDMPQRHAFPPKLTQLVVHATLRSEQLILMASDLLDEPLTNGNHMSILLECQKEGEMEAIFDKLKMGGQVTRPIQKTHWGAMIGGLTDQFGNQWMLHHPLRTLTL